jgi:tetratricopeptide (TPR) repeat protein
MKIAAALLIASILSPMLSQARSLPSDEPEWAPGLAEAQDLQVRGQHGLAIEKYRSLLSSLSDRGNLEIRAFLLSQIADSEIELGDYGDAEKNAQASLALLTQMGKTQTGTFAIAEGVLADVLRVRGDYTAAEAAATNAVQIAKATLGHTSPRYGILLTELAMALLDSGKIGRGLKVCQDAAAIFANSGTHTEIQLGAAYQNLAAAYALNRKPKKALDAITRAISTWQQVLPPGHKYFVYALATEVQIDIQLKLFREGELAAHEMLRMGEAQFGNDHPERLVLLNHAAALYVAEKKYQEAEPLLTQAVQLAKQLYPAGHPVVSKMLDDYSFVLKKLNRNSEAAIARAESNVVLAFPQKADIAEPGTQKH